MTTSWSWYNSAHYFPKASFTYVQCSHRSHQTIENSHLHVWVIVCSILWLLKSDILCRALHGMSLAFLLMICANDHKRGVISSSSRNLKAWAVHYHGHFSLLLWKSSCQIPALGEKSCTNLVITDSSFNTRPIQGVESAVVWRQMSRKAYYEDGIQQTCRCYLTPCDQWAWKNLFCQLYWLLQQAHCHSLQSYAMWLPIRIYLSSPQSMKVRQDGSVSSNRQACRDQLGKGYQINSVEPLWVQKFGSADLLSDSFTMQLVEDELQHRMK